MKKKVFGASIFGFVLLGISMVWAANVLVEDFVKDSFDQFIEDLEAGDKITYQGFQVNQLDGELRFERLSFQWAEIPATATTAGMQSGAVTFNDLEIDFDLLRFENAMALLKQSNSYEFDMDWTKLDLYSDADEFSLSAMDGAAKGLKLKSIGNSKGLTLAEHLRGLITFDKLDMKEMVLGYLLRISDTEKSPVTLNMSAITVTDFQPDMTGKIEFSDVSADIKQLLGTADGLSGKVSMQYGYMQAVKLMKLLQKPVEQDAQYKNLWQNQSETYQFLSEMRALLSADQNRLSEFEKAYFKNLAMDFLVDDTHVVGTVDELLSLESSSTTSGEVIISNLNLTAQNNSDGEVLNFKVSTDQIYTKDLDIQGWVTKIEDVSAMGEQEFHRLLAQDGWINFLPEFKSREGGVRNLTLDFQSQVSTIGLARWYDLEVTEDKTMSFGLELVNADVDLEILRQEALPAYLVLSGAGLQRFPMGFDFKVIYEPTTQRLNLEKLDFSFSDLAKIDTEARLEKIDLNKTENLDLDKVVLQQAELNMHDTGFVALLKEIAALMGQKKPREIDEAISAQLVSLRGLYQTPEMGSLLENLRHFFAAPGELMISVKPDQAMPLADITAYTATQQFDPLSQILNLESQYQPAP